MPDLAQAPALAAELLDTRDLARRWVHVQAVAARASKLAAVLACHDDRALLVAAAWLPDIGYSPVVAASGLHALDGARHLDRLGYPHRLCGLVAHHSGARFEAAERGLTPELDVYVAEDSAVADALTTADLTTSPEGFPVSVEERTDEILTRYATDDPVHRAVSSSRRCLLDQVDRTLRRLPE